MPQLAAFAKGQRKRAGMTAGPLRELPSRIDIPVSKWRSPAAALRIRRSFRSLRKIEMPITTGY
jgi:hypothetical protein